MSSTSRFTSPNVQYLDANGNPYAGAKLFFYLSGTSTKNNTYSDSALATPNTNPVVLDSAGYAGNIFLSPGVDYKVVLAPSTDSDPPTSPIWTRDPVATAEGGASIVYATKAIAAAATIASSTSVIRLEGYYAAGDGGGSLRKRQASQPAHSAWFQSADGAYWENVDPIVNIRSEGAKGDGVTSDKTAITNALSTGRTVLFDYTANGYSVPGAGTAPSTIFTLSQAGQTLIFDGGWILFDNNFSVLMRIAASDITLMNPTIIGNESIPTTPGTAIKVGNGVMSIGRIRIINPKIRRMGQGGIEGDTSTTISGGIHVINADIRDIGWTTATAADGNYALDLKMAAGDYARVTGHFESFGYGNAVALKVNFINYVDLDIDCSVAAATTDVQGGCQFQGVSKLDGRIRLAYAPSVGYGVSVVDNANGGKLDISAYLSTATLPALYFTGTNAAGRYTGYTNATVGMNPDAALTGLEFMGFSADGGFILTASGAEIGTSKFIGCTAKRFVIKGDSNRLNGNLAVGDTAGVAFDIVGDTNRLVDNEAVGHSGIGLQITGDSNIADNFRDFKGGSSAAVSIVSGSSNAIGDVATTGTGLLITGGTGTAGIRRGRTPDLTTTWNPGAAPTSADFTVTGAAIGNKAFASLNTADSNVDISANVKSANTVTVSVNATDGTSPDYGEGTLRIWLLQH